ncbi:MULTISPECIES: hypothetical protein [unclassified Enterobacter cloacae complex]|uniref:hypothetical protein n=1 Tax=unclassified Enterobacter cloacae complex TaxID=2757714 RepID=UPI001872C7EF|nr:MULTISPECIES: hypothetical protein [unclassified Enterobacter cloacae complex]MBE4887406.1 hypothetical protein [Enterobacter cloacae complex sp. P37RS]MBE7432016.1 hypothetical protein [Enterobacter cloacae complex sp. P36RS]
MKKLKVEKTGCWGTINGVFQQLPVGHEFIAAGIPIAFLGRVSLVSEVDEQEFEVATPSADDKTAEQADTSAKSKKAK